MATFDRPNLRIGSALRLRARLSLREERQVRVHVDDAGLHLGETLITHDDIRSVRLFIDDGFVVLVTPRAGSLTRTLRATAAPVARSIRVADLTEARELLEALDHPYPCVLTIFGLAPTFELSDLYAWRRMPPWLVVVVGIAILCVAAAFLVPLSAWGALLPLAAICGALAIAGRAIVGCDGVLIAWIWTRRFIPFAAIVNIVEDEERIILELRSGEHVGMRPTTRKADVVARLRAALEGAAPPGGGDDEKILKEGSLGAARVAELRRLGRATNETYRDAHIPRDRLWAIVEDPGRDARTRANAAAALSGELDEAEVRRLQVVANTSANPRVRLAISRAAIQASDEILAVALADVEAEEDDAHRGKR